MKLRFPFTIERVLQVSLVITAIFVFLGASDSGSRFDRLGHELMCQCGCNEVLLECNHVGCTTSESMRRELTAMINNGDSDKMILANFVQKYGPVVLAAPTKEGFDRVAWIMPYLVLVLGIVGCVVLIRVWKHRHPVTAAVPQTDSPALSEYRRRVHEDTEL
jgi:cytochrome c-type biogenesis protein CcmH